jgi:hypothetical protein
MILSNETIPNDIVKLWAMKFNRKMVLRTYKSYNPLKLVSEFLTFVKSKTNSILIIVENDYYKYIYLEYFNAYPDYIVKIYTIKEAVKLSNVRYDFGIVDCTGYMYDVLTSGKLAHIIFDRYLIIDNTRKLENINAEFHNEELTFEVELYKLSNDEIHRFVQYNNFIIEKYRLFKSLARHFEGNTDLPISPYDIMRYCIYGMEYNGKRFSYNNICGLIATEEGWHPKLQPNTINNKMILDNFHPDRLHDIAIRLQSYIKYRNDMLNANNSLFTKISKFANHNNDEQTLCLVDTTKLAEFISNQLNSEWFDGYPMTLAVGNTLTSRLMFNYNTNNVITDKKGNPKKLGTVRLLRAIHDASINNQCKLYIGGKTIKTINVPPNINKVLMTIVEPQLIGKFEQSHDLDLLLDGSEIEAGLTGLTGYLWLLPTFIKTADDEVILPKPLSNLIKMLSDVDCKRAYLVNSDVID